MLAGGAFGPALPPFQAPDLLIYCVQPLTFDPHCLSGPAGRQDGPGGHEMSGSDRFQPQLRESDAGRKHAGVHRSHRAAGHHLQGAAGGGERRVHVHVRLPSFSQTLLQNMRSSLASVI